MVETKTISRNELTAPEVQELVEQGVRVLIEMETLGEAIQMSMRKRAGTYYCDTGTKLLTHDTGTGFRNCLVEQHLVRPPEETAPVQSSSG